MAACFKACVACPLSTQESASSLAFPPQPSASPPAMPVVCLPPPRALALLPPASLYTEPGGMKELESTPIIAYMSLLPSEPRADLDRDTEMNAVCVIMRTGLFPWAFIVLFPYKNSYYVKIGEDSDYYFAWALPAYVTDRAKLTFYFIPS